MTIASNRSNTHYFCGCRKWETETIDRAKNGAALLIHHDLIGTHSPRSTHPTRQPVRRRPTDVYPARA